MFTLCKCTCTCMYIVGQVHVHVERMGERVWIERCIYTLHVLGVSEKEIDFGNWERGREREVREDVSLLFF